jgi:hypothetical protein
MLATDDKRNRKMVQSGSVLCRPSWAILNHTGEPLVWYVLHPVSSASRIRNVRRRHSPESGHLAMYVMIGPWWLSGQAVQRRFTTEPAGAAACRAAGLDPMMPPVVLPPHSRSARLTLWMGKLPWIAREMRAGYILKVSLAFGDRRVHDVQLGSCTGLDRARFVA